MTLEKHSRTQNNDLEEEALPLFRSIINTELLVPKTLARDHRTPFTPDPIPHRHSHRTEKGDQHRASALDRPARKPPSKYLDPRPSLCRSFVRERGGDFELLPKPSDGCSFVMTKYLNIHSVLFQTTNHPSHRLENISEKRGGRKGRSGLTLKPWD